MSKSLIVVGAAALVASATMLAPAAQAGKGIHIGFGPGHHHHHHRRVIIVPVYTEAYRVKPRATVVQEKKIIVSYADGMGRVYDVASKVWHDGQNHCWTGKLAWTFKNGGWFYGSYRWSPAGSTWRTNAPDAPSVVDCQTSPAFAAKNAPTVSLSDGQKELGGYSQQGGPSMAPAPMTGPVKTAEKQDPAALPADGNVARTGECKKYFPNVGETLPVPCND